MGAMMYQWAYTGKALGDDQVVELLEQDYETRGEATIAFWAATLPDGTYELTEDGEHVTDVEISSEHTG